MTCLTAVLCMLVVVASCADTSFQCPSPVRAPPAKLSILNFRNPSGQWTSQLNFTRDTLDNAPVWDIDLVQDKVSCGDGGEFITILLTLTSLSVDTAPIVALPQTTAIKPGYQEVQGVGIFKLHTTAKTWADAYDVCSKEGTHLAVINSEAEANYFKDIMQKHSTISGASDNAYFFLGFQYSAPQKKFITVQGTELAKSGYTVWASNQPNNSGDMSYSCGGMERSGKLHDLSCTATLGFFCEQ